MRIEGLQGGILFGMLLIVFHLDDPNLRLQLIVEIFGLLASEWRERERERERDGREEEGEMERWRDIRVFGICWVYGGGPSWAAHPPASS